MCVCACARASTLAYVHMYAGASSGLKRTSTSGISEAVSSPEWVLGVLPSAETVPSLDPKPMRKCGYLMHTPETIILTFLPFPLIFYRNFFP